MKNEKISKYQFIFADDWVAFSVFFALLFFFFIILRHGLSIGALLYFLLILGASALLIRQIKIARTRWCKKCNKPMRRIQDYQWYKRGPVNVGGYSIAIYECDNCGNKTKENE